MSGRSGQNTNYPGDGFVAVLAADGKTLERCTYLGGSAGDAVEGIAVSADGHVLRAVAIGPDGQIAGTGETRSGDLKVTLGAADPSLAGGNDFDVVVAQLLP